MADESKVRATIDVVGGSSGKHVIASMAEIDQQDDVEYKEIPGWKENEVLIIGSLTAGDMIEWSEANEGEAKRTAGLRLIGKSLCGPAPDYRRYAFSEDPKVFERNVEILRRRSHKKTEEMVKDIIKLNGMRVRDQEERKNA